MMPAREPQTSHQIGLPGKTNSRWDAIWQLVLRAEQLPAGERDAFLQSADTDPFIIRQAVAILEGGDSLASVADSLEIARQERFVPQTGMKIGRYRVGTLLGSGGAGSVYSAFDEELNRPVAMKFVSSSSRESPDVSALSLREARAASALNHPNIIMIHEVIDTGGETSKETSEMAAIVMELVQGRSLAELRGTLPSMKEVLSIAAQISKAFAAAHANGIIHGDIKPENIMLRDDGYAKVLDFGLARTAAMEASAWAHNPVFGTLRYMSPEQARGESLTPASDIFSFGLVLFELAAGRPAFDDASPLDAVRATLTQDPPAPASVNPQIPADLNSLILAMLVKDPAARPLASEVARQLADNLQTFGERAVPERTRPPERLGRWFWRAVLVASAVATTAGWFVFVRRDPPQFANLRIQPLTSQAGWEASPAISPDGKSVAFTWTARADTPPQIYVKQLNDSAPIRLTDSHSEGAIGSLAWSPDGKSIAFMRQHKGLTPIFVIGQLRRR